MDRRRPSRDATKIPALGTISLPVVAKRPKVLVIGAQGALGRLCARALADAGLDVVRAGRRPERAPDFRLVNLDRQETIVEACGDVDLTVTTVRHPAHAAERAVMKHGGTLLNVASLRARDRAELKSEASNGLVVLHAGLAPGVYSLVLKEMLAAHSDADGLEIAGAYSAFQSSGPAGAVDFFHSALDRRGRLPTRVIEYPEPIGRRRCLHMGGAEIGFFGEVATGRAARVYLCFIERPINAGLLALNALGLLSRLPRRFFTVGRRWTQRRTTSEPKRDVLAVSRGERRLAAYCVEGLGDYGMTAAATACFAEALLERRAAGPASCGVVGAEEIFSLEELQPAFKRRGIRVLPLSASG
jgi:NAD(P)-dependent dehydrogenase (short-subunit alcohol dehydrogenase family)